MLAIGRALTGAPKCLMLDEPSLGIAPILVKTIFQKIVEINQQLGITVLLVEQNANLALDVSSRGYVLETGEIILQDTSAALKQNPQVRAAYLGRKRSLSQRRRRQDTGKKAETRREIISFAPPRPSRPLREANGRAVHSVSSMARCRQR